MHHHPLDLAQIRRSRLRTRRRPLADLHPRGPPHARMRRRPSADRQVDRRSHDDVSRAAEGERPGMRDAKLESESESEERAYTLQPTVCCSGGGSTTGRRDGGRRSWTGRIWKQVCISTLDSWLFNLETYKALAEGRMSGRLQCAWKSRACSAIACDLSAMPIFRDQLIMGHPCQTFILRRGRLPPMSQMIGYSESFCPRTRRPAQNRRPRPSRPGQQQRLLHPRAHGKDECDGMLASRPCVRDMSSSQQLSADLYPCISSPSIMCDGDSLRCDTYRLPRHASGLHSGGRSRFNHAGSLVISISFVRGVSS